MQGGEGWQACERGARACGLTGPGRCTFSPRSACPAAPALDTAPSLRMLCSVSPPSSSAAQPVMAASATFLPACSNSSIMCAIQKLFPLPPHPKRNRFLPSRATSLQQQHVQAQATCSSTGEAAVGAAGGARWMRQQTGATVGEGFESIIPRQARSTANRWPRDALRRQLLTLLPAAPPTAAQLTCPAPLRSTEQHYRHPRCRRAPTSSAAMRPPRCSAAGAALLQHPT